MSEVVSLNNFSLKGLSSGVCLLYDFGIDLSSNEYKIAMRSYPTTLKKWRYLLEKNINIGYTTSFKNNTNIFNNINSNSTYIDNWKNKEDCCIGSVRSGGIIINQFNYNNNILNKNILSKENNVNESDKHYNGKHTHTHTQNIIIMKIHLNVIHLFSRLAVQGPIQVQTMK
eukprot:GHVR01047685.1.p1 GENE.GHVR01047685.1~~GHVR01047685.1.p1  ORF type:complete len:171 (+),score=50.88 GHVR01047685.1:524-1036(+)